MTSIPAPTDGVDREVRRAYRDLREPVAGGVASGLARHLALPVVWVRVLFVVLTALGGMGVLLYAALWLLMPADSTFATGFETGAPGLESAARGGRRPTGRARIARLTDAGPVVVLAVLGVAAVSVLGAVVGRATVLWPLVLGVVGVGLLWRQADEAQRERWLDASGRVDPVRVVLGDGGWASYARLGTGVALIVTSVGLFALRDGSLALARDVTVAALLGVAGIGIVAGPWMYRLAAELAAERSERVRTQERADVAAHLHDSVLQTLALIQNSAADPAVVARLARAQERDLRAWLYAGESTGGTTLAGDLRGVAAAVEDAHGIEVDVVTVGDLDLDDALHPLVAAAREALTNAARHAGVTRVDVYAEVGADHVEVFVRDRGRGFDPDAVAADRHGVRHSILDRMARHGGTGEVRSAPGEGTEVRLRLPRTTQPAPTPTTEETR